jgi:hypothetical protein
MRCINCGYDNLEGMRYCVKCGNELMTLDEKGKRKEESEKENKTLIKVIIGLVVVAVLIVILLIVLPRFGTKQEEEADNDIPVINDSVDQDTVGVWNCSFDDKDDTYTTIIKLQSDGVFQIGPIDGLDENRFEGTFTSNNMEAQDENGIVNYYQVFLRQNKVIENGAEEEVEEQKVLTMGIFINDESKASIADSEVVYHCSRDEY